MFRTSLINLAVLLVVLAVHVQTKAVQDVEDRSLLAGASTQTVTVVVTSFFTTPTTTTVFTAQVCGKLDPAAGVAPVPALAACRRRRQYWIDVPLITSEDIDVQNYFREQFHPSKVLQVEPTPIVQFRKNEPVVAPLESSLDDDNIYVVRADSRLGFSTISSVRSSISSIASSVISSFLTPVSTTTSTVSAFSSTVSTTIFTLLKTYTIKSCIPTGVSITLC